MNNMLNNRLKKVIANEATELRSEVDSAADYNAAQCGQNPSNSA